MDATTFPAEQSFDTVIFLNVLEHLADDAGALRNVYAALENGGIAVVLVPYGPKLFGTLDEVLGHRRRYTEKQLIAVGQSAGFKVERAEIQPHRSGRLVVERQNPPPQNFRPGPNPSVELADTGIPRARSVGSSSAPFPDSDISQGRWLRARCESGVVAHVSNSGATKPAWVATAQGNAR